MKTFRFWFGGGYVDINADSEADARRAHGSELVTVHDGKQTFLCFSLKSASSVETLSETLEWGNNSEDRRGS